MPKKTVKKEYSATLILAGKKYSGTGATTYEAIESIRAPKMKTRGILVIDSGVIHREKILSPLQVIQLIHSHGMNREAALKRTALVFEGL